jgi:UDP-N-acetylglucosamine/UDP-N-acetylgalactosamine diphosphorylase
MDISSLRSQLDAHGQGHLLQFASSLSPAELTSLVDEIKKLDLARLNSTFAAALAHDASMANQGEAEYAPVSDSAVLSSCSAEEISAWRALGLEEVKKGRVAAVLLAGGQGTRLGSSKPKGQYDIGLVSHSSLFRIQAERIRRVQALAGAGALVPWYVMTSPQTDADTREYFAEQKNFGLEEGQVFFFEQATLPAFSLEGKILLETKHTLATAPNGNGGIYEALHVSGVLEDMRKRGVVHVQVYSVDNALGRVADPVFIGFMASRNADCGAKVVGKRGPDEKVGVVCLHNGKPSVVEYTEIGRERSNLRNPDGSLTFNGGNICYHYYTREFLDGIKHASLHHVARKKIKTLDEHGNPITPTANNGIKLETFIFDEFSKSQRFAVLEVIHFFFFFSFSFFSFFFFFYREEKVGG